MLWDMRAAARDPIQTLKDASSSITSMSILSSTLYTSSLDGHIRTYDLRLGKMIDDLVGHPITSLAQSKIGDTVLVSSSDGNLRVFDTANGSCLQTMKGHKVGQTRTKAVWGYGESSVIAGDEDGKVWAWDVLEGKVVGSAPLDAHKRAITWVEVNPNGKEMVTASLGE
jgi:mitogen-activated protein kinase organizer 1